MNATCAICDYLPPPILNMLSREPPTPPSVQAALLHRRMSEAHRQRTNMLSRARARGKRVRAAMPSPSKKPRLHLRSRARDDVLLNRLLSEVRSHEKKVREELRRADETIADLQSELDQERGYTSRVKTEREQAR